MKKRIIGLLFSSLALSLGAFLGVISSDKKIVEVSAYYTPSTHYEVSDTASELASYYNSISDSDTGTSLLSKLQSLNSSKRKKTVGYSGVGTNTNGAFIYTDYDLNSTAKDSNGQTYGTKVASFYTKTSATSWNREHMWPNSHGGNNVEADILHTRPTISSENSSRGNSFYVEGKNSSSAGWDPYTAGYDAEVRGECARVILYCVVAYPNFTLSDADSHSTSNSNKDNMMGNMNTLIKWHFDYAPNVYEMNRNNGAEYLQGNRNPFVDHPEYVARIWSNFNSTVSSLCSNNSSKYESWTPGNYCNYGSNTPVNDNAGVSISASSISISVGGTTTLSATASNSGTIYWATSNSSIASISSSSSSSGANITITGVAAGTATITARATINGTQYSKTCTVTVTKVVSSLSKGSTSPTKTTYVAGESFDPTGLTITATYSDSTSSNVTSSVAWTPNPLTAGTTSVTGTFGGKSITITGLTVNAQTEPEIIDSNSDLSVGDYVVLHTSAGVGVTGWNNNKDATVSETESAWKKYYVASASSSGFTLKDEAANNFIASPGSSNQFVYGNAATCSTDSSGHLICNSRYLCKNGTNYRFYVSTSNYLPFFIYKVPTSTPKTLTSISVNTAPTKTIYTVGETFDPTGLVINRNYSDSTSDTYSYSGHTSEFTFTPSTSTALTTSNVSVAIAYGGKSTSQAITVNEAPTGELTASLNEENENRIFYVGEYIHNDDIDVKKGSQNLYDDFLLEGSKDYSYTFTYDDAPSDGGIGYKTFEITDSNETCSCSLTVQVQREPYEQTAGSNIVSVTYTDLPTSYQTSISTVRTAASGVKFIAYNLANYSSKMQFKASGGYFQTTEAMNLKTLTINNRESNALTVYGSTNGTSFSQTITGKNDVYDLSGYNYVKVMKNGSGAAYCASLSIGLVSETAKNVSNYIMYADTENQCEQKLDIVVGYLSNLSLTELHTFQTSSDYVIATARTRLEAWAASKGKSITYTYGHVGAVAARVSLINSVHKLINNNALIVLLSLGSVSLFGTYFFIRKRKEKE